MIKIEQTPPHASLQQLTDNMLLTFFLFFTFITFQSCFAITTLDVQRMQQYEKYLNRLRDIRDGCKYPCATFRYDEFNYTVGQIKNKLYCITQKCYRTNTTFYEKCREENRNTLDQFMEIAVQFAYTVAVFRGHPDHIPLQDNRNTLIRSIVADGIALLNEVAKTVDCN